MIRNQWYGILWSKKLKAGKIVAVRRFGLNLILFRTEDGKAACVLDGCAHRKASLGGGCVRNGNIACPFHGIEYDASGKCVFIPSDGRSSTVSYSRFDLKHFPIREIGDIIFAWYGDSEPDKEPDCFELLTDRSFVYSHLDDHWKVHYSRVIENQLDVSHLAFVHRTTIGRGNKTLVNGPKVEWIDDNTFRTSANNETDNGQIPKSNADSVIKSTNLNFKFPSLWLNNITDKIKVLAYFVPVDDENAILSVRFYNRITGIRIIDRFIAWLGKYANKVIERQDKRVVETQNPKRSELRMDENLVTADRPIIEYRTKRNSLM